MKPNARYADRGNQIIRQWRLLVLLRRAPRTLPELAQLLECTERTVRRDIYALQAVPLPIGNKYPAGEGMDPGPMKGRPHPKGRLWDANVWAIGVMDEWPRTDELPARELRKAVR